MPVYQYEGQHYDLPDGLTNEQAIAKIEAYLNKASSKAPVAAEKPEQAPQSMLGKMFSNVSQAMQPKYSGGVASSISKGITDPLSGVAQMALKGASALGIPGAEQQAENIRQRELQYEQSRQGQGFDFGRLAGNILSPASLVIGPGTGAVTKAASTGAIQGAMQPVSGEDFLAAKALQTGAGAALGGTFAGGTIALGKVIDSVKGLSAKGRQEALQKYLNTLAGEERDAVIKALQDAKELVTGSRPTVAEALADVPSAVDLIAAQSKLAKKQGVAGMFESRAAEQQAARVRAIQNIAGTEAERVAVAAQRDAVTGPMRETALAQADLAGPKFTRLEKEIADGFNSLAAAEQTAGMVGAAAKSQGLTAQAGKPGWLTAGDTAADAAKRAEAYSQKAATLRSNVKFKQYQLQSLEQNGFFPLRVSDLVDKIDGALRGTSSDTSKAILTKTKELLLSKADENGIIGSRDLYENVRKPSNQQIAQWLGLGDQYASGGIPPQAAKTLGNIKSFIDSSLNASTEGLWSKYLNNYKTYSDRLNRMEIGDYLSKKLQTPLDKERAGVFATAVENAAATIQRSTGIPRFSKLDQILTPQEVGSVNAVLADLTRKSKTEQLASRVGTIEPGLQEAKDVVPQLFSRPITLLREVLGYMQKGSQTEFDKAMAQLMLDPALALKTMTENIPKSRLNAVVNAMMQMSPPQVQSAMINAFTVQPVARKVGE